MQRYTQLTVHDFLVSERRWGQLFRERETNMWPQGGQRSVYQRRASRLVAVTWPHQSRGAKLGLESPQGSSLLGLSASSVSSLLWNSTHQCSGLVSSVCLTGKELILVIMAPGAPPQGSSYHRHETSPENSLTTSQAAQPSLTGCLGSLENF